MNGTVIPTITITITAQFTAARTATTDELRIQLVFPESEAGKELFTEFAETLDPIASLALAQCTGIRYSLKICMGAPDDSPTESSAPTT